MRTDAMASATVATQITSTIQKLIGRPYCTATASPRRSTVMVVSVGAATEQSSSSEAFPVVALSSAAFHRVSGVRPPAFAATSKMVSGAVSSGAWSSEVSTSLVQMRVFRSSSATMPSATAKFSAISRMASTDVDSPDTRFEQIAAVVHAQVGAIAAEGEMHVVARDRLQRE